MSRYGGEQVQIDEQGEPTAEGARMNVLSRSDGNGG